VSRKILTQQALRTKSMLVNNMHMLEDARRFRRLVTRMAG